MLRSARVCLLGLVLSSLACKQELDDKPAADPLEDPWVNSIDEGEAEVAGGPALAAAPVPAQPTPAVEPGGGADPTSAVLAQPTPAGEVVAVADPAVATAGSGGVAKSSSGPRSAAIESNTAAPSEAAAAPVDPAQPSEPAVVDPAPAVAPSVEPEAAPAQPVAPALTIADFNGNYRYSGGSAQRADLDQAIEDAVMQLAMPIRGIGRKRLTNTNPIDDTLDIEVTGDQVKTIFESGFDAQCTLDGGTVKWTSKKGDKYKVRVRQKGTKLVQVIEGEDGVKTTVFVLSADKQSLTVHHKIEADRLETPMTYKLSYKRK